MTTQIKEILKQRPELGKEIADFYKWICNNEGRLNRLTSKYYIEKAKEIMLTFGEDNLPSQYAEELQRLQEDLDSYNKIQATTSNLGMRIQLHLICKDHNLFGTQTGWVDCAPVGADYRHSRQHRLENNITLCGIIFTPESEPKPAIFTKLQYSPLCSDCAKQFTDKVIKERLDKEPDMTGTSSYVGFDFDYNKRPVEVSIVERDYQDNKTIYYDIYGKVIREEKAR